VTDGAPRVFVACESATRDSFVAGQARRLTDALRRRGHRAVLVADAIAPPLRGEAASLEWALLEDLTGDALWVMHYDEWSGETRSRLTSARGPRALWYHGSLPPERLARDDPGWERAMQARRTLPDLLSDGWTLILADSDHDRSRIARHGARDALVVQPLLDTPRPRADAGGERPAATVLAAGPVTPGRGLDHVVKAVALVRRLHRPDARLILSGPASGHERFVAGLEALAARLGATGAVAVADAASDEPVPAAVAVDAALDGGYPLGTAAAMLRGCPAIVVAGGPAAATLGRGALVLPDRDPPLLAEAIAEVLAAPALGAELAAAGRAATAGLAGSAAEDRVIAALAPVLRV
jgi:glycosyltransferase involved in cell wall biosynthesis